MAANVPPAGDARARSAPTPLMAGGLPLSEAVADEAAQWLTLFMSNEATAQDRERWMQWRAAHADHERAWRHIEAVTGRLREMEPSAAYQALSPYAGNSRRKALRALLWGGVTVGAGLVAWRRQDVRQLVADHRSGTGEQRQITLEDGTQLVLNTSSAVNVRFDAHRRLVRLVAGELLVITAHGDVPDTRPFVVQTEQGRIRALGTRFTVRQLDSHRTRVAVLQSAVEITTAQGALRQLTAGELAVFTTEGLEGAPRVVEDGDTAWTQGQIVAERMRLDVFLAELSRYRAGVIRCAPAVAGLPVSGVFPLDDTDVVLRALGSVLPVEVTFRTRYWVMVNSVAG